MAPLRGVSFKFYPVACSLRRRLSRSGLIAYASSTDCVGPIASSVADAAALLGAVAGEDRVGDSTALQQPVPDYTAILREVRCVAITAFAAPQRLQVDFVSELSGYLMVSTAHKFDQSVGRSVDRSVGKAFRWLNGLSFIMTRR